MKTLLLLILTSIISFDALAEKQTAINYKIEKVENLENLPNNEILKLYQDKDGFIWIATSGGLYQFDGYKLKEYRSNIYHKNLLTNNKITCLFEDNNKNLFIGTNTGLNILDKRAGTITKVEDKQIRNMYIADIIQTLKNKIFIGTRDGLFSYNKGKCTRILNRDIKDLYMDSQNNIWIGTWNNGLYRYDEANDKFIKYPKLNNTNSAHVICEDSYHRLWIGSFGYGLTLIEHPYDLKDLSIQQFTTQKKENSISDNYIYAIIENPISHTLIIGTRKGMSITSTLDKNKIIWKNIFPSNDKFALAYNNIDALLNDHQGNIWIGTLGGGIYYIKTKYLAFKTNRMLDVQKTLHSNSVRSLLIDSDNQIWTGISTNGLTIQSGKKTNIFPIINKNENRDSFTKINCIAQSHNNKTIYLGTEYGLYYYKDNKNHFLKFPKKVFIPEFKNKLINQIRTDEKDGAWIAGNFFVGYINDNMTDGKILLNAHYNFLSLLKTDDHTLWLGTEINGLLKVKFNPKNFSINSIKKYNIHNNKIPSLNITDIYQDSKKRIWVSTDGAGVCLYDDKNDLFVSLNNIIDFPTDIIKGVIEDDNGTIWMGSNIGLIRFYPEKDLKNSTLKIYNKKNGLPDNSFHTNAITKSKNNEFFFGTHYGYIHFFPNEINDIEKENSTFITDVKINNQPIASPIVPGYADKINIPGNYSNFTIEFAPMLFTTPNKVRYAYKLEPYDTKWQYTNAERRFAHYANLPPRSYNFILKSTNEYGKWNKKIKHLKIDILPPLYKTWWAYLLYSASIIALIIYILYSARQRLRLKTAIKIEKIEKEKSCEVNQTKLRFFTNVTHELFTPITIISAAIENSKNTIPRKDYSVISSNTNRLIRLIQQILEFRKTETGNLKLQVSQGNLTDFIAKNIESFRPLMRQKNINIEYSKSENDIFAYFDADKIDKILYNLLSNGLKYNINGACLKVTLSVREKSNKAIIMVQDNGNGLSENVYKNLFKRFYDGDFREFNTIGTGIGLSLVKDLVTLHKGVIKVDNKPKKGVRFTISFPINKEAYSTDERDDLDTTHVCNDIYSINKISCNYDNEEEEIQNSDDDYKEITNNNSSNSSNSSNYNILVVEDNLDLMALLQKILSEKYTIYSASNGQEAINILEKEDIHLVLSDVMMPVMDGYELCKFIKNNINYNHISVVLLTAKIREEDEINGYDVGADSYIKKPFSISILKARIENLLETRKKIIISFQKQKIFEPEELDYTPHDEEFIKNVMDIIHEHYTDTLFDQNQLSEIIGLSKSTLYRKLKAITGMTPSNLIKDVRLKMAYRLLEKKGGTRICEIAYIVGFNDPKYFSMCFKKEFGVLPSEL